MNAIEIVRLMAGALREMREVPCEFMCAVVVGPLSAREYESAVALLVRQRLVERAGDLLRWVGPEATP